MKLFVVAAFLVVAASAAPSDYAPHAYMVPLITITSQSDERNADGSSKWSYTGSDYTAREESQIQKKFQGTTYDSYGRAIYGDVQGNTNRGSSYWVSPEGEKFTLTWTADENGFRASGKHLPVAPVHVYELPVAPVHVY